MARMVVGQRQMCPINTTFQCSEPPQSYLGQVFKVRMRRLKPKTTDPEGTRSSVLLSQCKKISEAKVASNIDNHGAHKVAVARTV